MIMLTTEVRDVQWKKNNLQWLNVTGATSDQVGCSEVD